MSDVSPWHWPKSATEGADRFRAPKGPLWKQGDPSATWMVHFDAGSRNINKLGYTANPSDEDLIDYAKYHHALLITVKEYVGVPLYWTTRRLIKLDVSDWL